MNSGKQSGPQPPEFKIDHAALQRKLEQTSEAFMDRAINQHIAGLFRDGSRFEQPEGFAHVLIKSRIDNFFASDRCAAMMDACIERHAEPAMDHATKKLLQSRSRKKLFAEPQA